MNAPVPYLSGLRLSGRRVVVVGAGRVAERRLYRLLEAGATIEVIAPDATAPIQRLDAAGRLTWTRRSYLPDDLADAWYVLVATRDSACNEQVSAEAERQQIFCVRADDRDEATAWTPASAEVDGVQVGVLAGGDHHRSRRIRDTLVQLLIKIIGSERRDRAA
ncbi:precorrin-2 dehydrogenase/sirohydrochlorin ferrochelatase family protein [Microlunatus soli]|uniref:precorrin-2 dehydrogenase n=1 Tax=Microlunatus soli TaxID=630515 RepID=A0A1H1P0B6_9ACTN|nr:NAD(P)-dependent oxidoreductase [Microlunatus soli]SDS04633.1 siroheme synthase, N-terminal domain-containing protein [Microlunatus soli]